MSTIRVAMLGMGYKTMAERRSCGNCDHSYLETPNDIRSSLRCRKGGFYVRATSICREHVAKPGRTFVEERAS